MCHGGTIHVARCSTTTNWAAARFDLRSKHWRFQFEEFPRIDWSLKGFLSTRERIHRPSDSHADQQKKEQRPHNVFHAVDRPPPAQKAKRDGNQQGEEQHGLQMAKLESQSRVHALRPRAASYACSAASRFSRPAVARKRVP